MRDLVPNQIQINKTLFVSNNTKTNTTVLKELQIELNKCDSFSLSVAFITMQGITMILEQIKNLEMRDVKGRILTSTYQMFNHPDVFKRLLRFKNIEVRIYSDQIHHTKGYIFDRNQSRTVMVGSSNLTQGALKGNREWNLKVENAENDEMTRKLMNEFEDMWDKADHLNQQWIDNYESDFEQSIFLRQQLQKLDVKDKDKAVIPNKMQLEALRSLDELRQEGKTKALLISATGTGKTYLSAFDVRNFNPKRALFIIHREQIARDAERTFRKVMPERSTGILSGTSKDTNVDILFTTIQSLSIDRNLHGFSPEHFDYIIYDEAHRSGANSYLKVMKHLKPQFTLGMTATPERTDDFNVFELFDYNIAYEIRLNGALEEKMLTPFHYFGVTDVTIDGEIVDDQTKVSNLVSQHRVDKVVDMAKYYGHDGDRVKGLIFCSRNEEANALSSKLNDRGFNTIALSGANTQMERETAINRLTEENGDLDYILTVDIFNEGIDIPEINQIIMIRPTQSAIVFVQQLGRGLRKHGSKDYVVIIDFIGNYKNNFMIPIALSGDRSLSKNNLRKYMMEGNNAIPGYSTIEFDQIAKERIYKSIDAGRFNHRSYIIKEYENLKYKLGRMPMLVDFLHYNSLDPQTIFANTSFRNYYKFIKKVDDSIQFEFTDFQDKVLTFISLEFSTGKRTVELEIIQALINFGTLTFEALSKRYGEVITSSALNYLSLNFLTQNELKKYEGLSLVLFDEHSISLSEKFKNCLDDKKFMMFMNDLLEYGLRLSNIKYKETDNYNMVIGEQYTRKDVTWLLNWGSNQQGTVFGYKVDHETKTIPLFITYNKSEEIEDSIMYHDYFIEKNLFHWMSRNKAKIESSEIQSIINAKENGYRILLFIKRSDGEDKYFYYLGPLEVESYEQSNIKSKGKELSVVNFIYKLKNPVRDDLYYYFIED